MGCAQRGFPRGQRRLRKGRRSIRNQVYHVTTSTCGRADIFADLRRGRAVVAALRQLSAAACCRTLCFVVMPDHLHWLMQPVGDVTLADCVRRMKGSSARNVNRLGGVQGRVWQRAFHDHALRDDEDVVVVARYIIANPVRAGIVERIGDYPLWDAEWL